MKTAATITTAPPATVMSAFSDLLSRWLSCDIEVSHQAFREIKELGRGALPFLREVISTGSSMRLAACRLVLEMDESEVSELVLPLFAEKEMSVGLLESIERCNTGYPCVWPAVTDALRDSDRIVRLRALDAVQSQITRAMIEDLYLEDWAKKLIEPLGELVADQDVYVSMKAAELIFRLALKSDAIAKSLEVNIPRLLGRNESSLSYFAMALMVQELGDEKKAGILGDILRRGVYGHDRFVAALCAGELGEGARSLLPECQNVLDSISGGKSRGSSGQLKSLRLALDRIQGVATKLPPKAGETCKHPRLRGWMHAMEAEEYVYSSSAHSPSTIALEQIRRSRDESLVGPLIEALSGKINPERYRNLTLVVNALLTNTANGELRDWLIRECNRENLKSKQIDALLDVNQPEVMPLVRRVLFTDKGKYANRCLDHLKRDASDQSVDLLCEVGRRDPSLRLLVVFALEASCSRRAVPYLLELAKRDLESKKHDEIEWRAYAILALGRLGDTSVIPDLCELMAKQSASMAVLRALADLGDARGLVPAIGAVRKVLASIKAERSWSDGYRTPIYNLFLLARKCGRLDEPELVALVGEFGLCGTWNKLLPQENVFLASLGFSSPSDVC